eukprot:CFRG3693T1
MMGMVVRYSRKRAVIAVGVCASLLVCFLLSNGTPVGTPFDTKLGKTNVRNPVYGIGHHDDILQGGKNVSQYNRKTGILYSPDYVYPVTAPDKKENAVIVVLVRNRERDALVNVVETFQRRFNDKYKYPYVMLNDEPFTDDFKDKLSHVLSSSEVEYALVPPELWNPPEYTNMTYARQQMKAMAEAKVMYGGSESYRKMCRFYSGTIFKVKELQKYDYLWRLDSAGVKFHCDMDFDPFVMFREQNLVYGFTIGLHEYKNTIPTLWNTVKDFMVNHKSIVKGSWMNFFTDDGQTYNGHHFWSNFEILDLNFFRAKEYQTFFDYLDRSGGFFYERWGDAVIHSLGVGLFADKSQVRWMEEIGYSHNPFTYCPLRPETRKRCDCHAENLVNDIGFSCAIDFTRTPARTIADQLYVFEQASDNLWELATNPDVECDVDIEVDDSGKYRTCKDTPVVSESQTRSTEACLVYSFGTIGSAKGLTATESDLLGRHCEVHVFNPYVDLQTLPGIVGTLHKAKKYGIAFHQTLLAPANGKATPRDPSTHLHYTEMSLGKIRSMLHHEEYEIDVLKIDLEGGEWEVLADFVEHPQQLDKVKYIMIELHLRKEQIWRQGMELPEILENVKAIGFEVRFALSIRSRTKEMYWRYFQWQ